MEAGAELPGLRLRYVLKLFAYIWVGPRKYYKLWSISLLDHLDFSHSMRIPVASNGIANN